MSSAESAAASYPPPSANLISLSQADLGISCIFLLLGGYITWRHGKTGMVCWPIFLSAFIARIIADAYLLANQDEPLLPNAVTSMTGAAVTACLSLTLIGAVYQCNTMLPTQNKHMQEKILLGITHLLNTAGIGIATYAGSPSATGEGGVINQTLNRVGNILLLVVMVMVYAWMWPTWLKIKRYSGVHPNVAPVRWLFFATTVAMPFWLIRLITATVYAFAHQITSLDPVMGSYQVKLLLLFGTYFFASTALLVGGWYGVSRTAPGTPGEYQAIAEEFALARGDSNGPIEMVGQPRLK